MWNLAPSSPRGGCLHILWYLALASVFTVTATFIFSFRRGETKWTSVPVDLPEYRSNPQSDSHPVDHLIRRAQVRQKAFIADRSYDVKTAARKYRDRRGRHPPPGFDAWVEAAVAADALVVEDFFDRIHHDLNPFWAIQPWTMRMQANMYLQVIRIRNGRAHWETDDPNRVPWIQLWQSVIQEVAPHLPDMDIPINYMNEPRLLVPWKRIDEYMRIAERRRNMLRPEAAITSFELELKELDEARRDVYDPNFVRNDANRYWDHMRLSCSPQSPSYNTTSIAEVNEPVEYPVGWPAYTYQGYIANFTQAKDACEQPHLRGMHGTFIEPISMSTSHELIPLFGGSKLPMNNEILMPPAMYFSNEHKKYPGSSNWASKKNQLLWRGDATGGRNKASNWHRFHRHRFVQMTNGTTVGEMENAKSESASFDLPIVGFYNIEAQKKSKLGEFVSNFSDVAFAGLECFPRERNPQRFGNACSYNYEHFKTEKRMSTNDMLKAKYVPDLDGDAVSEHFRELLLSSSLPIKASIYTEWSDDRLLPWAHFVPMDNSFQDIYGIMDYFLSGRDDAAHRIAEEGRAWANMVLRRDDMVLYIWRVLLEYARLCSDDREKIGFVRDLYSEAGGDESKGHMEHR
jgi:hypothetical protein